MKLRIGDRVYDYQLAIRKIPIRELLRLQSQGGPNRRQIQLAWDLIDAALRSGSDDGDYLDNPDVLLGMAGTIFIAKAYAGEPISWDDAQSFAWPEDVQFVVEESDLPDEPPDPPEASGSATLPDAEKKSVKRSPAKTSAAATRRTSKPR